MSLGSLRAVNGMLNKFFHEPTDLELNYVQGIRIWKCGDSVFSCASTFFCG